MVLIRLTPRSAGVRGAVGPELAADILWAAALPGDRLEHIRARAGPHAPDIDLVLFHRAVSVTGQEGEAPQDTSLRLCRRAIARSPALAGWSATVLLTPPEIRPLIPDPYRPSASP